MADPSGITRRTVTVDCSTAFETTEDLGATITATSTVPSLVWAATGGRIVSDRAVGTAPASGTASLSLIPSDIDGWTLGGQAVEVDPAIGKYSHAYNIIVQPTKNDGPRTVAVGPPITYTNVIVPSGTGAFDLDNAIQIGGTVTPVTVPGDFTGPAGPQGAPGPQGPMGPVGNVPNGTIDGTALVWDAANSAWTASQRPVGGLIAYAENATGVATVINSAAKQGPQGLTISVPPTPGDVWISFRALITTTSASVAGQFASYILNQSSQVMWTGYSSVFATEPANSLHTMTGEVRIGPSATTQSYALAFGTGGGTVAGSIYNGNKAQGLHSWIRAVAL